MPNRSRGIVLRVLSRLQAMNPLIHPTSSLDLGALRGS
jgi:hypothetical protein